MKRVLAGLAALAAVACAHDGGTAMTISEMHQMHDWQNESGAQLSAALASDVSKIARRAGRAGTLSQLQAEGYECLYGEAHEDYPEPAAVCSRSFATRACQMDWEVTLTSNPERADSVDSTETAFRRDCVSVGADWPQPVVSGIDTHLAPVTPPKGQ